MNVFNSTQDLIEYLSSNSLLLDEELERKVLEFKSSDGLKKLDNQELIRLFLQFATSNNLLADIKNTNRGFILPDGNVISNPTTYVNKKQISKAHSSVVKDFLFWLEEEMGLIPVEQQDAHYILLDQLYDSGVITFNSEFEDYIVLSEDTRITSAQKWKLYDWLDSFLNNVKKKELSIVLSDSGRQLDFDIRDKTVEDVILIIQKYYQTGRLSESLDSQEEIISTHDLTIPTGGKYIVIGDGVEDKFFDSEIEAQHYCEEMNKGLESWEPTLTYKLNEAVKYERKV